jgi:hypothetical protein
VIVIKVQSNIKELMALHNGDQKHMRLSAAIALTKTAKAAQEELRKEMEKAFDRPTPYALNSTYVRTANVNRLEAEVGIKDESVKGTPAINFLGPQIGGGERRLKRFEKALQANGLLPDGMYAVPGSAAEMDGYGNISKGQIMKILSALRAAEMYSGYSANRAQRLKDLPGKKKRRTKKKQADYFVGRPGGGKLPLGIWQVFRFGHGSAVKPVIIYTSRATYKARFDFQGIVDRVAARDFDRLFVEQLNSRASS